MKVLSPGRDEIQPRHPFLRRADFRANLIDITVSSKCVNVCHLGSDIENMHCRVREMELDEARSMIRYFLDADLAFLNGMGVDPEKLPLEATWFALLEEDFARPIHQKQFYYLAWEIDDEPAGHCNINKIAFGRQASMHLHIWNSQHRRRGCASQLVQQSVVRFFERFELRQLYCEPYALNPAPNRTLPKAGFRLARTYETTPGWIAFHQPVNRWELDRDTALAGR